MIYIIESLSIYWISQYRLTPCLSSNNYRLQHIVYHSSNNSSYLLIYLEKMNYFLNIITRCICQRSSTIYEIHANLCKKKLRYMKQAEWYHNVNLFLNRSKVVSLLEMEKLVAAFLRRYEENYSVRNHYAWVFHRTFQNQPLENTKTL